MPARHRSPQPRRTAPRARSTRPHQPVRTTGGPRRVHEVEALIGHAGEQPAAGRRVTVFHPMCGRTSAWSRSTDPSQRASPGVVTPCSVPVVNATCIPTQIPRTGRPRANRSSTMVEPPAVRRPAAQAANAPTRGPPDRRSSQPARRRRSPVHPLRHGAASSPPNGHCRTRSRTRPRLAGHSPSVPLVLGTPTTRGSRSTAVRSARATDLNCASTMWWALRPETTRTCNVIWAVATIDSQMCRVRGGVVGADQFDDLRFLVHQVGAPERSTALDTSASSNGTRASP